MYLVRRTRRGALDLGPRIPELTSEFQLKASGTPMQQAMKFLQAQLQHADPRGEQTGEIHTLARRRRREAIAKDIV